MHGPGNIKFVSCIQPSFCCNLCSPSNFTNKNLTQLDLEIQNTRILVTIQNEPRVRLTVFNHDGRYHHLRKYLTFLQNSVVYGTTRKVKQEISISPRQSTYLLLSNGLWTPRQLSSINFRQACDVFGVKHSPVFINILAGVPGVAWDDQWRNLTAFLPRITKETE
jgi:hypothetical protein